MRSFKFQVSSFKTTKNKMVSDTGYGNLKILFGNLLFGIGNYFVICAFLFIVLASGCAIVKETAKGIIGVSTKELGRNRPKAIKKVFNCEYKVCYNETIRILKETGAYIYAVDVPNNMVAVYVSQGDTTPVGVFFKKLDVAKTQIEVSSPSKYAKELIAKNIFTKTDKICLPKQAVIKK